MSGTDLSAQYLRSREEFLEAAQRATSMIAALGIEAVLQRLDAMDSRLAQMQRDIERIRGKEIAPAAGVRP